MVIVLQRVPPVAIGVVRRGEAFERINSHQSPIYSNTVQIQLVQLNKLMLDTKRSLRDTGLQEIFVCGDHELRLGPSKCPEERENI